MNCFDDIPENDAQSYPCDCGGSITLDNFSGTWFCDSCDWELTPEVKNALKD
jgi:hypothetical protein